jgi:hypothetical protein
MAPGMRVAAGLGLWLAALIWRTHLSVGGDGLTDRRMFRVVRVRWQEIDRFEVRRPGALWGGYCVSAVRIDGPPIDLLSTRAYSLLPSARYLDELHRICWTLEEAAPRRDR